MEMKALSLFLLATFVSAEPPVGNRYLPPSSYSTTGNDFSPPPPGIASSYGPPSNTYGAPSSGSSSYDGRYTIASIPSTSYGAPTSSASSYSRPSSTYGPPSRSRIGSSSSRLSTRYGSPSSKFGSSYRSSALSSTYGPPSFAASSRVPSSHYGAPSNSLSSGYNSFGSGSNRYNAFEDSLSEPAQYEFTYDVSDSYHGTQFGHRESREHESAFGEYRVLLPDGRTQVVTYEADENGFRPTVRYEDSAGGYGHQNGGPY